MHMVLPVRIFTNFGLVGTLRDQVYRSFFMPRYRDFDVCMSCGMIGFDLDGDNISNLYDLNQIELLNFYKKINKIKNEIESILDKSAKDEING